MRPAILVEQRTLKRMNSVSENITKKSNGENIVRIILIALAFFVVIQISTREPEQSKRVKLNNVFV
jgi:hypothetical protein